jgi:phosphopantetheinyl transferase (holo-ACP synthase)
VNKKFAALLLVGVIASGLIYTHPAYAHNFGGDESASWLAKVAEIKTEVTNVAKHVGDKGVIGYYSDALGEYWNSNDTREMGERNTLLQQEIPSTINATLSDASAGNQSMVNNDVTKLNGYLDESVPVRVDKDKLSNSTVQALAVTFVLKEALEKYGTALNSTVDLNDMSQMNMSGNNMSSMSNMAPSAIVDANAYENSVSLATAAQQMFSNVASQNSGISSNSKISDGFTKLVQDLNNKADANTIMMDCHVGIHPMLIMTYNIQGADAHGQSTVPEFPMPVLLSIISIAGVVVVTRFKSHLGF